MCGIAATHKCAELVKEAHRVLPYLAESYHQSIERRRYVTVGPDIDKVHRLQGRILLEHLYVDVRRVDHLHLNAFERIAVLNHAVYAVVAGMAVKHHLVDTAAAGTVVGESLYGNVVEQQRYSVEVCGFVVRQEKHVQTPSVAAGQYTFERVQFQFGTQHIAVGSRLHVYQRHIHISACGKALQLLQALHFGVSQRQQFEYASYIGTVLGVVIVGAVGFNNDYAATFIFATEVAEYALGHTADGFVEAPEHKCGVDPRTEHGGHVHFQTRHYIEAEVLYYKQHAHHGRKGVRQREQQHVYPAVAERAMNLAYVAVENKGSERMQYRHRSIGNERPYLPGTHACVVDHKVRQPRYGEQHLQTQVADTTRKPSAERTQQQCQQYRPDSSADAPSYHLEHGRPFGCRSGVAVQKARCAYKITDTGYFRCRGLCAGRGVYAVCCHCKSLLVR